MKTIVKNLKAQIEKAKKERDLHEAESKRLFELYISIVNKEEQEKVFRKGEDEDEKARKADYRLRCLRHALCSMRDINNETYDHFQPEID